MRHGNRSELVPSIFLVLQPALTRSEIVYILIELSEVHMLELVTLRGSFWHPSCALNSCFPDDGCCSFLGQCLVHGALCSFSFSIIRTLSHATPHYLQCDDICVRVSTHVAHHFHVMCARNGFEICTLQNYGIDWEILCHFCNRHRYHFSPYYFRTTAHFPFRRVTHSNTMYGCANAPRNIPSSKGFTSAA